MSVLPVSNNEQLNCEYTAYRQVNRIMYFLHYAALAGLFVFLCRQFVESHGLLPGSVGIFFKEVISACGIWYLFDACENRSGMLKLLQEWELSLLQRIRREDAIEILRKGGHYFIDDLEMTLVEGFLVPRRRLKEGRDIEQP